MRLWIVIRKVCSIKLSTTDCKFEIKGEVVLEGVRERYGIPYKANIKHVNPKLVPEMNVAESEDSLLQLYHEQVTPEAITGNCES